jgi:hypothetical protein
MKKAAIMALGLILLGIVMFSSCMHPIGRDTIDAFSFGRFQISGSYPTLLLRDVDKHIEIDTVKAYETRKFKLYVKGEVGFTIINLLTHEIWQVAIYPNRFGVGWSSRIQSLYGDKYVRLNSFENFSREEQAIFNSLKLINRP